MSRQESSDIDAAPQDVEWGLLIDRWILFVLMLVCVLSWAAFGWLTWKPMHPLLALRTVIVGFCLAYLSAFALWIALRGMIYLASPRYRRAKRNVRKRLRRAWFRARLKS